MDASTHIMKKLNSERMKNGEYEISISWEDWDDALDRTWEPLTQLKEDVPGLVEDFLHSPGQGSIKARILYLFY